MTAYPLTVATLLLAFFIYIWSIARVGGARGRHQVQAPAVTGHPEFERILRAQQNTVEQLVVFVPLLALAAAFWGDRWGALYGVVWCIGRALYIVTYAQDAQKRSTGFMITALSTLMVMLALVVTLALRIV